MPRDLYGHDPVLGYTQGDEVLRGAGPAPVSDARKAGILLSGLALQEVGGDETLVDREELAEVLRTMGIKSAE